ncbi:lytic murein transglycosylase, partial [Mesorhizobium sp.]|uniref:lytic murein transglycosylase n=1 Tax=Mesorhizobium sp. TaxID=1871066 RepID=UPI0025F7BE57
MTGINPSKLAPGPPLCPAGLSGRTERGATERGFSKYSLAFLLLAIFSLILTTPTRAAPIDDQFQAWLRTDLWPEAKSKGISKKTFDEAFLGVKPNLKLPDLVLPGEKPTTPEKQHQAEFGPPANYFAEKIIRAVTTGGRARESANSRVLGLIEKRYGVPGEIVLAIWGRETGFGAAKMPYDAFEVLGTKAFMSTKKDFFRTEVLAALDIAPDQISDIVVT